MKHFIFVAVALASLLHAQPAGRQVPVGSFPMSAVASPDGKYLLVLNCGVMPASISVVDTASAKELSRVPVADAWLGLTFNKTGDKVYLGGGSRAAVFEFSFANGTLTAARTFPLVAEKDRTPQDFAGDVRFAPDGHLLYVANVYRDSVVVMNPQSGIVLSKIKTGRRPDRLLFHPSGKTVYVASWADGAIGQYDVNSGERLANFRVAQHPSDMVWLDGGLPPGMQPAGAAEVKARLFVPAANTNSVYVFGASETGDLTKLDTLNLSLTGEQPLGSTPSAVTLSRDKKLLYVTCSDLNTVAVIDLTGERSLIKGFIQTAAYPTAVVALAENRVAILNGRAGSVQIVDPPDDDALAASGAKVLANLGYGDEKLDTPEPIAGVHHVVYVLRDMPNSTGDSAWLAAGMENDYLAKLGHRFEGNNRPPDPANLPPAGYLWTAATQAGLKIRNYGFMVHNLAKANADGEQVDRVYDPALTNSTDMEYRGPDPALPDADRAKEFATEMNEYEQLAEMPQLLLARIGPDPAALQTIEDAVAKSKFHGDTALFIVDAAPAPASNSRATVIAPVANGTKTGADYNALTALRTIELILGLRPMTIFDASARPLYQAFRATP